MKICNAILPFLLAPVVLVFILCVVSGCKYICNDIVRLVIVCFAAVAASVLALWAAPKDIWSCQKSENHFILKFLYILDLSLLLLVLSSSCLGQILGHELPSFAKPVLVGVLYLSVLVTLFLLRWQGRGKGHLSNMLGKKGA